MVETYIKVKSVWKYFYRAVDKEGKTINFLLTVKPDKTAAMRFFDKTMLANGIPEKITMDNSGSNKAAIDQINEFIEAQMIMSGKIPQQHHRAGSSRSEASHKTYTLIQKLRAQKRVLAGIELIHIIRKGQSRFADS